MSIMDRASYWVTFVYATNRCLGLKCLTISGIFFAMLLPGIKKKKKNDGDGDKNPKTLLRDLCKCCGP